MIVEDNNGNSFHRPDWIDLVGTLGPLTPTVAYIAQDGAIYGPGGRLLATGNQSNRSEQKPTVAAARGAEIRVTDARTGRPDARQLGRIAAASSSLSGLRRHGDRPGPDRRSSTCR